MAVDNQKLQRMFDSDSTIMLETLRRLVGSIGSGELSEAEIGRAFRAAHSIKSEAGFLNVAEVADAAHRLEDALSAVRRRDGIVDDSAASGLRRGFATLEERLVAYRARVSAAPAAVTEGAGNAGREPHRSDAGQTPTTQAAIAVSEAPAIRSDSASGGDPAARERGMLREARRRGERLFRVTLAISSVPDVRTARGFLVVNNLELACAVVRTDPPVEELSRNGDRLSLLVTTSGDEDIVRRAVHVDEVEVTDLSELSYDELLGEGDSGPETVGESVGEGDRVAVPVESQEEVALIAAEILAAAEELTELSDGNDAATAEQVARITRYARVLRERVGWTGRIQLLDLFRELRQTAIRYAARQGKRIRILVGGNGATVTPAVGDNLLEAVLHLIRNSIDHGISTIDERARSGKHPAATIKVRVDRVGQRVRIVVQDDGRGIDEEMVRKRAGDSSAPLLDVIARSGFSTRERPDTNSGRGVGLDTVVHTVRVLLGGEIRLTNRPGSGMTFLLSVPATTHLLHVLIVEAGGSAYAIPLATVIAHQRIDPKRLKRDSFGALYYELSGETVLLSTVNGHSPGLRSIGEQSVAVFVRAGADRRAIVVDAVLGEESIVRESARTRRVYSRTLDRDVGFVFPAGLELGAKARA